MNPLLGYKATLYGPLSVERFSYMSLYCTAPWYSLILSYIAFYSFPTNLRQIVNSFGNSISTSCLTASVGRRALASLHPPFSINFHEHLEPTERCLRKALSIWIALKAKWKRSRLEELRWVFIIWTPFTTLITSSLSIICRGLRQLDQEIPRDTRRPHLRCAF